MFAHLICVLFERINYDGDGDDMMTTTIHL